MLFNSFEFAIFLIIVFLLYWIVPHRFRAFVLMVSSLYFYMQWNAKYVVLILLAISSSYLAGIGIRKLKESGGSIGRQKLLLFLNILVCLGLLLFFKYFNFLSESIARLWQRDGDSTGALLLNVILPVGISFYTFQTLGYVIDVYRGKVEAEKNFINYAAFIAFFPQLVAGPIERSTNLLPQITKEKSFSYDEAVYGLRLMVWGYYKKLVIADVLVVYLDRIYSDIHLHTGLDLILGAVIFPIQIYCDFSGYSDIATGCARLFGIKLMKNFDCPFYCKTSTELWRRWHMSLMGWFRDYVYIPLGGSRKGIVRKYLNIMIVFTLSGLWHGAAWHYVIWGALAGLFQILEAIFSKPLNRLTEHKIWGKLCYPFPYILFMISTVFFCARSVPDGLYFFRHCLDGIGTAGFFRNTILLWPIPAVVILFTVGILALYDLASLKTDVILWMGKQKKLIRYGFYAGILGLILLLHATGKTEFVYFQF